MALHTDRSTDLDDLPYLPEKVELTATDNLDDVVEDMNRRYEVHLAAWGKRENERTFLRQTLYSESDPKPVFPVIVRTQSVGHTPSYTVLPNGQYVLKLDDSRIQTLCGLITVIPLVEAIAKYDTVEGHAFCRSCHGHHLPVIVAPRATPTVPHTATLQCPKCQADAEANYVSEDHDTMRCRLCGHRIFRGGPVVHTSSLLTEDEILDNYAAIELAGGTHLQEEDEFNEDLDGFGDDPDHDESPEDGPWNQAEEMDVHADTDYAPPGIHFLDTDDLDEDPETVEHRLNQLHAPLYNLFTHGRVPLRQAMISVVLRHLSHPESQSACWTTASRFQEESALPLTQNEAEAIAEWIHALPADVVTELAGDPESQHPMLAHPKLQDFWSMDRLIQPLITSLVSQLRGWRNRLKGCEVMAERYQLPYASLVEFGVRMGIITAADGAKAGITLAPPSTAA